MKQITMTKKGFATVNLFQNENHYWLTTNGGNIVIDLISAENANQTYLRYRKNGYSVKPETENTEAKAAAPAKPEKKTAPKELKKYPEGFKWDPEQYYRIAKEKRYSLSMPSGKVVVPKKYRDEIYQLMADENNAK